MPIEVTQKPAPNAGVNQKDDPEHIDDNEALWIQDGLLDIIGQIRRRGPATSVMTSSTSLAPLAATTSSDGAEGELLVILGYDNTVDSGTDLTVGLSTVLPDFTEVEHTVLTTGAGTVPDHLYGWISPTRPGDIALGHTRLVDNHYDGSNGHWESLWFHGGHQGTSGSLTGTVTSVKGSISVSGSGTAFDTECVVGQYLTDNGKNFIGKIVAIGSATSITLETGATEAYASTSAEVTATRAFLGMHGKGRITTSTSSAAVTGVNTKFASVLRDAPHASQTAWTLYRRSDGALIGEVLSIADETTLTLVGSAAIQLDNEPFIAKPDGTGGNLRTDLVTSGHFQPGVIPVMWAGRQWYINQPNEAVNFYTQGSKTNRVFLSALDNPEDLDWSTADGDWFDLPSADDANEPVIGAVATDRALLFFKRAETLAVTGRTPQEFVPDIILNDGVLHPSAYTTYGEGAIWAGKDDIYYYDGARINRLVENKLGNFYSDLVEEIAVGSADTHVGSAASLEVYRDHVFLFLDNATPRRGITKFETTTTDTSPTIVVNLLTGAVSFFTNFAIRGMAVLNTSSGRKTYAVCNDGLTTAATLELFEMEPVFEATGQDDISMEGMTIGPDFYVEYRRESGNSEFLTKKLKRLRQQYFSVGGTLSIETVDGKGRGDINGVDAGTLIASADFTHQDLILTSAIHDWKGIRIYEDASVSDCAVGEFLFFQKHRRATRNPSST